MHTREEGQQLKHKLTAIHLARRQQTQTVTAANVDRRLFILCVSALACHRLCVRVCV